MRARPRHAVSKAPRLMLAPLLDMFTIILIFMIVSVDSADYGFRLNPGLDLPKGNTRAPLKPAVGLAITDDQILLDDRPVGALKNGVASAADMAAGEVLSVSKALQAAYDDRFGPNAAFRLFEDSAVTEPEPTLVIQADKGLPYKTLYLVLQSAARAGFNKYHLAILRT